MIDQLYITSQFHRRVQNKLVVSKIKWGAHFSQQRRTAKVVHFTYLSVHKLGAYQSSESVTKAKVHTFVLA